MTRPLRDFSGSATVGASLTTLAEILAHGEAEYLIIDVENTGAAALTEFQVQVKGSPEGTYQALLSTFAAAGAVLLFVSSTPATLAAAGKATIIVRVNIAYAVRLQAKCGTSTTATVRGILRG
jgi:hypothetical protein